MNLFFIQDSTRKPTSDIVHGGSHGGMTRSKALDLCLQERLERMQSRPKILPIQCHFGVFVQGASRQGSRPLRDARIRSIANGGDIGRRNFGIAAPKQIPGIVAVATERRRFQRALVALRKGFHVSRQKVFRRTGNKVIAVFGDSVIRERR